MERNVKWQEKSPPLSESSESPTLSEHTSRPSLKRKRSSIFSKLRKSILGSSSSTNTAESDDGKRMELKRALSMDAGLQNRISQLAGHVAEPEENASTQDKRISTLRRSKSLINPVELEFPSGIGSNIQSPKTHEQSQQEIESDSLIGVCETSEVVSLINTIQTSHLHLNHQIFDCSWLAPTRKFQLFPGHLTLNPKSSSIHFNCQHHLARAVTLKFHFDDILNISRGSWNDKRNQSLIIDLIRGKRKSWVFVAWAEDQFESAVESLVQAWRIHCTNKIKERIDRKNAHLNMKYCRIIKEADLAAVKPSATFFQTLLNRFFCNNIDTDNQNAPSSIYKKTFTYPKALAFEKVLYENVISPVIPEVLASILLEKSTSFMANFRALQGIETFNDSGWPSKTNLSSTAARTFVSLVKNEEGRVTFKWNVAQRILFQSPDAIIFQITFAHSNDETFSLVYEISSTEDELIDSDSSCSIRITSDIRNQRIETYFKNAYFPSMFQLLEAFVYESSCEFSAQAEESNANEGIIVLPPHYRFIKEFIKTGLLELNLYFTTVTLPLLYKLVHFKEYKLLRYTLIFLVLLFIFRVSLESLFQYFKKISAQPVNVDDQFSSLLNELSSEAMKSTNEVRNLKLKYKR